MEKRDFKRWQVIITIVIIVVGVVLSWKINDIYELQARVARCSSMPNIVINEKSELEEDSKEFCDTIIEVSNLDGRLINYHSEMVTFMECQYLDKDNRLYSVEIPVENYYILGVRSGTDIGVIETRETGGNFSKIELLTDEIREYNTSTVGDNLAIQLKTFIRISYINLLDEEENLYYESDLLETKKILSSEGEKKFEIYEKFKEHGWTVNPNKVDKVSIEDLFVMLRNISEEMQDESRENKEEKEDKESMIEIIMDVIVACVSVVGAWFATYFGARWALKNLKKEKYFEERKKIYYDLAEVLPVVNYYMAQSDYMYDCMITGKAEDKLSTMKNNLKAEENKLELLKKQGGTSEQIYEVETEISNYKNRIEKHKLYLKEMKELRGKIEDFEKSGKMNILRLFASPEVWTSYIEFKCAFDNEYNCNIGVTKEHVEMHINKIISCMREDLKLGKDSK